MSDISKLSNDIKRIEQQMVMEKLWHIDETISRLQNEIKYLEKEKERLCAAGIGHSLPATQALELNPQFLKGDE